MGNPTFSPATTKTHQLRINMCLHYIVDNDGKIVIVWPDYTMARTGVSNYRDELGQEQLVWVPLKDFCTCDFSLSVHIPLNNSIRFLSSADLSCLSRAKVSRTCQSPLSLVWQDAASWKQYISAGFLCKRSSPWKVTMQNFKQKMRRLLSF